MEECLKLLPEKPTHIGIVVEDVDKARKEIEAIYGYRKGIDFTYFFTPSVMWTEGVKNEEPVTLKLCMIEWCGPDGLGIELLQPMTGGNWEHAKFLDMERRGGIHHVAYYTKDHWEEYRQILLDKGAKEMFRSETTDDRGYRRCCYLRIPESGMMIEIGEPPAPFKHQQ